jgi:hypothetical protein
MQRLRALLLGFGLITGIVTCGPLSSRDKPNSAGADAMGGDDSGSAGSDQGGNPVSSAGSGGEPGEPGGAGPELGGAPAQGGGAGGSAGEAGAGGEPPQEPVGPYTIATDQVTPTGIAVDQKYAYWANRDAGTILRCPRYGCAEQTPTVLGADVGKPLGLSVDATHVYWINESVIVDSVATGSVYKCPLSGCQGAPTLVTDWQVGNGGNKLLDVQVVGSTLYIAAWPMLGTCSIEGCDAPTTIAGGPYVAVETDAQYFYGSCFGWSQLVRCPLGGCGEGNADQLKLATASARALTVDASNVYLASADQIAKCPLAGCGEAEPEVVTKDDGISPFGLTSNATRLYFTNVDHGTVVSIPK